MFSFTLVSSWIFLMKYTEACTWLTIILLNDCSNLTQCPKVKIRPDWIDWETTFCSLLFFRINIQWLCRWTILFLDFVGTKLLVNNSRVNWIYASHICHVWYYYFDILNQGIHRSPSITLAIMNQVAELTAPTCRVLLLKSAWELMLWYRVSKSWFNVVSCPDFC